MRVMVSAGSDELGKLQGIVSAFPSIWTGTILDVGCRSGNLGRLMRDNGVGYVGVDIQPGGDVIADMGKALPFRDRQFDVVVALDVLEHVDDIYRAFAEVCRVACRHVVVTIPNMHRLSMRLRLLSGQKLGGKYGLPGEPPADRHRWFFSLSEGAQFCHHRAKKEGFQVVQEGGYVGPRRGAGVNRVVVRLFPNVFCPTYLMLAERAG